MEENTQNTNVEIKTYKTMARKRNLEKATKLENKMMIILGVWFFLVIILLFLALMVEFNLFILLGIVLFGIFPIGLSLKKRIRKYRKEEKIEEVEFKVINQRLYVGDKEMMNVVWNSKTEEMFVDDIRIIEQSYSRYGVKLFNLSPITFFTFQAIVEKPYSSDFSKFLIQNNILIKPIEEMLK